ncbi:MAG: hypothetical protein LBC70_06565 [Chitinispirillales bacterium]|jgi:hypothetical protein|nr:hypothetical protein [Chitinispirillales bacterium]
MRHSLSLAVVSLVLFTTAAVAQDVPYVITDSIGTFTVRKDSVVVGNTQYVPYISTVVDAIRADALGAPVTIQFGAGSDDVLDIGTQSFIIYYTSLGNNAALNLTKIKLTGKITSAVANPHAGTVNFTSAGSIPETPAVEVEIAADIENTADTPSSVAVYVACDAYDITITGGTITSELGNAIYADGGDLTITDGIFTTNGSGDLLVYRGNNLTIAGGKLEANRDGRAISILDSTATLTLGGTPEIIGDIAINYTGGITADTSFNPGGNIYTIGLNRALDGTPVIVKNGAHLISNFEIVTLSDNDTIVETNAKFKLTMNGDDIVATEEETFTVTFNLNGGIGTTPASINVIKNARLSELTRPAADYVNAENFKSDGNWYSSPGRLGDQWIIANEFVFGTGNNGTRVTGDMTLVLDWTNIVSITQTDRVIPGGSDTEEATVAPIIISAGEFTAGPNPVARSSGRVDFFRQGKRINDGVLTIFDASGNVVNRVQITCRGDRPRSPATPESIESANSRRVVGTWDLTDSRGRPVSEGTYLARGVLTTIDGKRERVSVVVGVR